MPSNKIYRIEGDVKDAVKKLLKGHKWKWWMPAGTAFGTTGVADFNALKAREFLAVETKFGYNKPTPQQLRFLADVIEQGCWAFVVNERNINLFRDWLCLHTDGADTPTLHEKAEGLWPDFGD